MTLVDELHIHSTSMKVEIHTKKQRLNAIFDFLEFRRSCLIRDNLVLFHIMSTTVYFMQIKAYSCISMSPESTSGKKLLCTKYKVNNSTLEIDFVYISNNVNPRVMNNSKIKYKVLVFFEYRK